MDALRPLSPPPPLFNLILSLSGRSGLVAATCRDKRAIQHLERKLMTSDEVLPLSLSLFPLRTASSA